jgi:hypothetical protein
MMITAAQPNVIQASQAIGTAQAILNELVKRPRLGLKPLILTTTAQCRLLALSDQQLLRQLAVCLRKIYPIAPARSLDWEEQRQAAIAAYYAYHQARIKATEGPTLGEIPLFVTIQPAEQAGWIAAIEAVFAARSP